MKPYRKHPPDPSLWPAVLVLVAVFIFFKITGVL
jgi:hypothetical protein